MEYIRNCPKCDKALKTTNKYYFNKATSANSACLSCSQKGKIMSEAAKENMRKNHADIRGDKNPFYMKRHSDETKKIISEKITHKMSSEEVRLKISERQKEYYKTHDNPFKGKIHSSETKSRLSDISKIRFEDESQRKHLSEKAKEWHKYNTNPFKGKSHHDASKKKQRISALKRIESTKFNGTPVVPNCNPKESEYFKKIESEMGLDGIYVGKSGKQYQIKSLGYFPDFYDPIKNVIIEYDEKHHYIDVYNNVLRDKDVKRQNEIVKLLQCKFYRYNEKLDKLYEITAS